MTDKQRPRRIVRRAVMVLAGCVLLVAWYVAAWLSVSLAFQRDLIWSSVVWRITPVFTPLVSYSDSSLPGGDAMARLWYQVNTTDSGEYSLGVNGTYIAPEPLRAGVLRIPQVRQ